MSGKYNFICLNNDGYDGLRRPRHILMQRLAGMGFRVLFVSSAVNYVSQRFSRPHLKLGGVKRFSRNLYWYQPPAFLPDTHRPVVGNVFLAVRRLILRTLIAVLPRGKRVFFVSVPDHDYIDVIKAYPKSLIVYNVHDRYLDSAGNWEATHDQLMRRADIVLAGSTVLVAELEKIYDKRVYFFPPAIDFDLFPKDYMFAPRRRDGNIVIGCVGNLGTQIDWPLLHDMAAGENFQLHLVGPVVQSVKSLPAFQALERMSNVTFTGKVAHDQVPGIIKTFDVCIMPYVLDSYTEGVNPLKAYEYFALGKPVVTSAIPAAAEFLDLIYIASGKDAWCHSLRRAVEEDNEPRFLARRGFALSQDYDSRVALLQQLLEQHFGNDGALTTSQQSVHSRA